MLLVSRIKPTGKVHRLWRNYWERGRPGWPQCGEQRWLSAPPGPASSAGREPLSSCPLGADSFTPGMATGTDTHTPPGCSLWEHSWAEVDSCFLNFSFQGAPARSWAPFYLCRGWVARAEQCWQVLWVTPEKEGFHQQNSAITKLN